MTVEFADDIEKIRNSGDFKDGSLPVLVQALRQGAYNYGKKDREAFMKGTRV